MEVSNFSFLKEKWPLLYELGHLAEENIFKDPNTAIIKLRIFAEEVVDYIFAYDKLEVPVEDNQFNKLKVLEREGLMSSEILEIFHSLRKNGNRAVHETYGSVEDAQILLSLAYKAAVWFRQVYGQEKFIPSPFVLPKKHKSGEQSLAQLSKTYEERFLQLQRKVEEELAVIREEKRELVDLKTRREASQRSVSQIKLSKKESNKLDNDRLVEDLEDIEIAGANRKFITTIPLKKEEKNSKKVWDAVRNSFKDNTCLAYWRYPLFTKRGERRKEPDILIADKEIGLIIIEVKSSTIDQIENIEEDEYFSLAEDQLFTLLGYCDAEKKLRRKIEGRAVIALPNITSEQWKKRGFPECPILFADELGKKTLIKTVKNIEPLVMGRNIDNKMWNVLLAVLTGQTTFREETAGHKDLKTRNGVINIIKQELNKVDIQQEEIGKTIPPGPQRIRGIAGSGKTVLLCQKAAHMYLKNPDWKIALVFFTRSLYDNTIREIDKWIRRFSNGERGYDSKHDNNLQVLHAWGARDRPGFYREICRYLNDTPLTAGSKILKDYLSPNEKLVEACKILLEKKEIKPIFDAVLIDEAQDLLVDDQKLKYQGKQAFFYLAYKVLKPIPENGQRRLIWAYDEAQSLNSLNVPTASELFGQDPKVKRMVSGFHAGGIRKSEIMNRCYRTPGPVLVSAHAIGMGLLRPAGMIRGFTTKEDWQNIGYKVQKGSFRPGQKVVLHRPKSTTPNRVPKLWPEDVINFVTYQTREEELSALARKVKHNLTEDQLKHSRDLLIIVLGESKDKLKTKTAKFLINKGMDIFIPTALENNILYPKYPHKDPDKFWNQGGVTISNVYRAKGNEAYMVYVIGLDKIAQDETNAALRNQLFVALTRTKGWLNVSGIGSFSLYEEFKAVLKSGNTFEFTFKRPLVTNS